VIVTGLIKKKNDRREDEEGMGGNGGSEHESVNVRQKSRTVMTLKLRHSRNRKQSKSGEAE
jgi:hypothetical protein